METWQYIRRASGLLSLFAVLGGGLVALSYYATADAIARQERAALLASLNSLIPPALYDNDLSSDSVTVTDPARLGTDQPVTVYRARRNGQPAAVAFMPVAPDGYSGAIRLLVGIRYDGTLLGTRVISHRETPGLGDLIDTAKSDWIRGFDGRSLDNPAIAGWQVKKDGGAFDQFSGATITPRAVVKAVHASLQYYAEQRDKLY